MGWCCTACLTRAVSVERWRGRHNPLVAGLGMWFVVGVPVIGGLIYGPSGVVAEGSCH